MEQTVLDYDRIAQAIRYLTENYAEQPALEEVAKQVHLSPYHFQRLFTTWAGISPKKFVQYLSIAHLRTRIQDISNLQQAADVVGLSTQSRVYDLFTSIEAVTPNEFKTLGKGLLIRYGFHMSPYGECLIGATGRGICALSFTDYNTRETELEHFTKKWKNAVLEQDQQYTQQVVDHLFTQDKSVPAKLLLCGTNFQIKVWEALLNIPAGAVTTYQHIANYIGSPKAVRAVGTAVGQNPLGWLIPCHRVIRKEGKIGAYHWGETRKKVILGHEMAQTLSI